MFTAITHHRLFVLGTAAVTLAAAMIMAAARLGMIEAPSETSAEDKTALLVPCRISPPPFDNIMSAGFAPALQRPEAHAGP
jgi:hypothetical protein